MTDAYDTAVLLDSPFAYYRLEDTSGTVMTDSSGNGRNGTFTNSPALAQSGPISGWRAALFKGVNDYASATLNLSATKQATFECWFAVVTNVKQGAIWQFGDNADTTLGMAFAWYDNLDGVVNVGADNGLSTQYNITVFTQPLLLSWVHMVAAIDRLANPKMVTLYINGQFSPQGQKSFTAHNSFFGNLPLYLSRNVGLSKFLNVLVSRVAVYNTLLTQANAAAHFAAALSVGPVQVSSAAPVSVGNLTDALAPLTSALSTIQTVLNRIAPPIISLLAISTTHTLSGVGTLTLTGRGIIVRQSVVPAEWGITYGVIGEYENRLVQLVFNGYLVGGIQAEPLQIVDQYAARQLYLFDDNVPINVNYDVGTGCTIIVEQLA